VIGPEDIDRIRDGYRRFNEERLVDEDFFADDFLLEQTPGLPDTRGTFRGRHALPTSVQELLGGFDECGFLPHGFEAHGDWVIVPVTFWSNVRGIEQRVEIVHIWQVRDGQAVRMRVLAGSADPRAEIEKLS
jgi:ketosteroid isomerase-like protein